MVWEIKRDEVDRWTGNAITNVSPNTPEQQALVDEINTEFQTAAHIIAELEKESPGCATGVSKQTVERDVLQFMRSHGIVTVTDYENFLIKEQE